MKFTNTRNKQAVYDLKQVLFRAQADSHGLVVPSYIPRLESEQLKNLSQYSFQELAFLVMKKYFDDIPEQALAQIIEKAFNFPIYLRHLKNNIFVLELFHGPTLAFKDFGARFLAAMMSYYFKEPEEKLHVIVATSGDTGASVASAFSNFKNVRIYILYPKGKISHYQEKQFKSFDNNVTLIQLEGDFDECQNLAKQALNDKDIAREMILTTGSSINIGRLLPQLTYHAWSIAQTIQAGFNEPAILAIPSGNLGNLTAAKYLQMTGFPIKCFLAGQNQNAGLMFYLDHQEFSDKRVLPSYSNAMDIIRPSNLERLLDVYEGNLELMRKEIFCRSISDEETLDTIAEIYQETGYLTDPHTAISIASTKYHNSDASPIIVSATAHPAKFADTVSKAINKKIAIPKSISQCKENLTPHTIPSDYNVLKELLFSV